MADGTEATAQGNFEIGEIGFVAVFDRPNGARAYLANKPWETNGFLIDIRPALRGHLGTRYEFVGNAQGLGRVVWVGGDNGTIRYVAVPQQEEAAVLQSLGYAELEA